MQENSKKKSSVPATKWRDLSEEMLKDPESYYTKARERAAVTAERNVSQRRGFHFFGKNHRLA